MRQGKSSPYLSMLKHLLKTHGIQVSFTDLEMCLHVITEYNPWFPEEGNLDVDNWKRIRQNVEKAVCQGEKIPVRFWSIWSLIHIVLVAMAEELVITNVPKEMTLSIKDLNLDMS